MTIRLISMLLIISVVGLLLVLFGPAKSQENETSAIEPDLQSRFDDMIARDDRGFVVPPRGLSPDDRLTRRSGKWIKEDGVRYCDGYLTRAVDDKFCSEEVPSDWQPFEFNGNLYFVQPLTD